MPGHFKRRLTQIGGRIGPVLRICLIRAVCGVKPACRCAKDSGASPAPSFLAFGPDEANLG